MPGTAWEGMRVTKNRLWGHSRPNVCLSLFSLCLLLVDPSHMGLCYQRSPMSRVCRWPHFYSEPWWRILYGCRNPNSSPQPYGRALLPRGNTATVLQTGGSAAADRLFRPSFSVLHLTFSVDKSVTGRHGNHYSMQPTIRHHTTLEKWHQMTRTEGQMCPQHDVLEM